ncbi:MAG: hypothetical protein ABIS01_13565, partial [Ferruginibacter sp.]
MKRFFLCSIFLPLFLGCVANDSSSYTIKVGNNSFTVSGDIGGRIISYTCNGKEILIASQASPEAFGATFWPSPQSKWKWPPYPV